ncbi:MAG: hypothetical protein H6508_00005 [Calditrichaeota bacterium]|nr:hypothetical protein [Calditrichota bacterium]
MNKISVRSSSLSVYMFSLCALLALVTMPSESVCKTKIGIQIGGVQGTTCEGVTQNTLLAGSIGNIAVIVQTDDPSVADDFEKFPSTAPGWLHLEAGYSSPDNEGFVASPEILVLLDPHFFLSQDQKGFNEAAIRGESLKRLASRQAYRFRIRIPEELANQEVCVRAIMVDRPFDDVASISSTLACVPVVSPCSSEDTILVGTSLVIYTHSEGGFDRVIVITDSLLATGWRSSEGLSLAQSAANVLGMHEKRLEYLDLQYATFGTSGLLPSGPNEAESDYQRTRAAILRAIADQK